jgi:hypothetical protein
MVYDELFARLTDAFERGEIEPAQVEALLRRHRATSGRPDVPSLLRAAGALVCMAGAALLYGIGFGSYPGWVQAVTPFLFPAAALGAAIALHRARRPAWEAELAAMVGYVAFGLASVTSAFATGAGPAFGIAASLAATGIVLGLHAALRIVRLTGWGLSASLVAFTGFCADAGGILSGSSAPWWLGLQGIAAVVIGGILLRRSRAGSEAAWRSAALLGVVAAVAGMAHQGFASVGPWHVLLTLVVGAALVTAARCGMGSLMWIGALGSVVWLGTLAVVVGSSASWALAVIVFGLGLVGLAALVARRRGPALATPAI